MPKLWNVGLPKRNGNNRFFLFVRRAEKHYFRNVKFFSDTDGKRRLCEDLKNNMTLFQQFFDEKI